MGTVMQWHTDFNGLDTDFSRFDEYLDPIYYWLSVDYPLFTNSQ